MIVFRKGISVEIQSNIVLYYSIAFLEVLLNEVITFDEA